MLANNNETFNISYVRVNFNERKNVLDELYYIDFMEYIESVIGLETLIPSHYAVYEISKHYENLDILDYFIIDRLLQIVERDPYSDEKSHYILSDYTLLSDLFAFPVLSNNLLLVNRIYKLLSLRLYFKKGTNDKTELLSATDFKILTFGRKENRCSGIKKLCTYGLIKNVNIESEDNLELNMELDIDGINYLLQLCERTNEELVHIIDQN